MPLVLAVGLVVVVLGARRQGRQFVRYPDAEAAAVKNPHLYKGKPLCQACHPGKDRRLADDAVKLCQRCHSFQHGNHPVNVVAKPGTAAGLRLGEGRKVVCHSCHDPHDLKKHRRGLRMELTAMCLKCHPRH